MGKVQLMHELATILMLAKNQTVLVPKTRTTFLVLHVATLRMFSKLSVVNFSMTVLHILGTHLYVSHHRVITFETIKAPVC